MTFVPCNAVCRAGTPGSGVAGVAATGTVVVNPHRSGAAFPGSGSTGREDNLRGRSGNLASLGSDLCKNRGKNLGVRS